MHVHEFILHEINKAPRANGTANLRDAPIPLPESNVTRFTEEIMNSFKAREDRPTNIYAGFHSDTTQHPFSEWCRAYFAGRKDLLTFSSSSVNRLLALMNAKPASTGGYIAFAKLTLDTASKILVVMLHPHAGLTVDQNLNLVGVSHLELKHIDKAALIDEPVNGRFPDKALVYAGFRKEMSLYFTEFLGPDEVRNARRDTSEFIQVIDQYVRDQKVTPASAADIRGKVRDYAITQAKNRQDIEIQAVANLIAPANPAQFTTYATTQKVSATVRPEPAVFRKWKLVRHQDDNGIILQFPADLCGPPGTKHPILFDKINKTLIFRDLDPVLVAKIEDALL